MQNATKESQSYIPDGSEAESVFIFKELRFRILSDLSIKYFTKEIEVKILPGFQRVNQHGSTLPLGKLERIKKVYLNS